MSLDDPAGSSDPPYQFSPTTRRIDWLRVANDERFPHFARIAIENTYGMKRTRCPRREGEDGARGGKGGGKREADT